MKPLLVSVLSRPPNPTRDGLAIRNFHLLGALAGEFRLRAFALRDPERAYPSEAPEGVTVEHVPQTPRRARRVAAVAGSLLSTRAYSELLYRSRDLERRVAAAVSAERPAWVVAHSYHVAPAALSSGAPVWVDFHNLDAEIWRRAGETSRSAWARAFARGQARRTEALERELVRRVDGVSCVSRRDAAALSALGATRDPLVVPNGVDLARYEFRPQRPGEELVFFVGDLTWPPNADAVRWLREKVWPLVRRARPRAHAEILGRGEGPLLALSAPDFALLGEGGDTRPYWARAAVAVVPLLAGGGTRLKILEAAASGVPVVSTAVGAEGLELAGEREILVRDAPEAFAAAVANLLASPEAARTQAAAARARVEALYDWRRIGPELARELLRRAGGRT